MKRRNKIPLLDVKKYGGRQVAIVEGKVIAVGDTLEEVVYRARRSAPERPLEEIKIFSVPKTLSVIYYA